MDDLESMGLSARELKKLKALMEREAEDERLAEHVGLSEDGVCHPLTPDDMSMFYQLGLNEVAIDLAIHEAEKVQEHVRALG